METPSPLTPEQQALQGAKNAFRPGSVKAMRAKQAEVVQVFYTMSENPDDLSEQEANLYPELMAVTEEALAQQGVDRADPRYREWFNNLDEFSVDRINYRDWDITDYDADGNVIPSGRDLLRQTQQELFGSMLLDDGTEIEMPSPEADVDPDVLLARNELNVLRDKLAAISAKRQGKVASFNNEEYKKARDAYNFQLRKLTRLELKPVLEDGTIEQGEKNTLIVASILDDYKRLREKTNEELGNKQFRKFVDAFGKFMSKGNLATRIGKGVLVGGAVAGSVGFLLPMLGLGAGGAVAGLAATRVSGLARAYAIREAKNAEGGRVMSARDTDEDMQKALHAVENRGLYDELLTATDHFDELYAKDTKSEQVKRRKSVGWSVGAIALGSGIAFGAHELANHLGGSHNTHKPGKAGGKQPAGGKNPHTGGGHQPQHPGGHQGTPGPEHITYSHDAATISSGEGWYQTFNEMGVHNPHQQAELLKAVGPRLERLGIAYRDPNIGGWGISHSGHMPKAALDLIHHAAVNKGYLAK